MSTSAAAYLGRPRRRWIWAFVAMVTAAVLILPVMFRMTLKAEIRHELLPLTLIRHPLSQIQVDAPGQSITIRNGAAGQVRVMSNVAWLLGKPTVSHAWSGRILKIQASCPSFNAFGDCQAGLVIRVPAGVAVRAAVGSGSVTVTGMAGPVRAIASSGSINLTDLSGPIWATTASGSIAARGLTSARVVAATASGQLALAFAAPPEAVALSVDSGAAGVTMPPGSHYLVSGQRGPGSLTIAPGLNQAKADRIITVVVGSGQMHIGYSRSASSAAAGS